MKALVLGPAHIRGLTAVAAALAALAVGGGLALATITHGGTIGACHAKRTGEVRVADPSAGYCKTNEAAVPRRPYRGSGRGGDEPPPPLEA